MTSSMRRMRRMIGRASCTGALALLLSAGGCDDSTPLSDALYTANIQINALAPSGAAPATPEYKAKVLGEIVRSLQANASNGTQSESSAAQVLIAQAQIALAENPAGVAAVEQREALNLLTAIETALSQWQMHSAEAAASAGYDPAPALTEIDRESRDRDAKIRTEQARKAEVDAAVAKLLSEAAAIAEDAKTRRAAQADLSSRAAAGSAVQGEELIRQAALIGREADALEAQSADLEAQAAKIAPTADEIQLGVQRLNNQRALLDRAQGEVVARAEAYRNAAKEATRQAQEDAAEIDRLVEALSKIGAAEGASAFEQAVQGFENAATSARKAQDPVARGQAMLASGAARHALGDLHWARAHALARVIETLDALATAKPPLPASSRYKTVADQTRQQRAAALDAATTAYQAAFDDYTASGAKGESQERMERVRQRLGRIAKATSGGKLDLAAGMAPETGDGAAAPEEPAPSDAPEAAADQTTPAGTIALLIERSKNDDAEGIFELLHAADETQQAMLTAMRPLASKMVRLEKACRDRFGQGLESGQLAQMGGGMSGGQFRDLSAADFEITESDETASAAHPDLQRPIGLVRVDDLWKIDFGGLMGPMAQMPTQNNPQAAQMMRSMMSTMMASLGTSVDELTAEVEAGQHESIEAVQQALMQRLQSAMSGGLQNIQRPGGGG